MSSAKIPSGPEFIEEESRESKRYAMSEVKLPLDFSAGWRIRSRLKKL